ncbi:MAG: SPOR domain-containing protein [Deltaproteobacteria bacterium]|nr:SPOR domain-containing protein [Deltaproteobacteria bacterium]
MAFPSFRSLPDQWSPEILDLKAQNLPARNVYTSICNLQSAIINDLCLTFLAFLVIILSVGCGGGTRVSHRSQPAPQQKPLARLGYSIQVGAFANLDNAVRLSKVLERRGLDAYYFVHKISQPKEPPARKQRLFVLQE